MKRTLVIADLVRRRKRAALMTVLAAALSAAVTTGPASAAPQSKLVPVPISSDTAKVADFFILGIEPTTLSQMELHVVAEAKWSGNLTTLLGWDSDKVRQGTNLDVTRSAPLVGGTITVHWTVTGQISPFAGNLFGWFDVSKDNYEKDVSCSPKFSGSVYTCGVQANAERLFPATAGMPYVKLGFELGFDITPEGAVVTRNLSIGGTNTAAPDLLSLTASSQTDTIPMPCSAQPADAVDYRLGPYSWSPQVAAHHQAVFEIGMMDLSGLVELPSFQGVWGDKIDSNPNFHLTGAGFLTPLGTLLQNNVSPTIDPLGPFSGTEGSPVSLSANVGSACPISSAVWEFSDGTKSFGLAPKRAFADNGEYNGQLAVTDVTGRATTRSFTVDVTNLPPVVNAGPDTTADWGQAVQFNGQATDPGSADQSTLQYSWAFGDGTPSASGGAGVLHAYSQPGTYTAALKVCDKDGACAVDTRDVIVTTRDTTLGYTGPLSSAPSKTVTLKAHLVDEYGQPVVGRKVTFQLGSQSVIGTTDSSGNASADLKLTQKVGSYPLSATFPPGDAKYDGSADLGRTFVIGK